MQITFLLGNGFDIGLGLKTRYEDFYDEYSVITEKDSEHIKKFKKMLKERDSKKEEKIIDWSDFEKAFGEYSNQFTLVEKQMYIDCFEDFVTKFNSYLETEESQIDYFDKQLIGQTMRKAVESYCNIREEDTIKIRGVYEQYEYANKWDYNFISFNYTKSVDECAAILKEVFKNDGNRDVGKVLHIHGYIEENMIMGVNDSSQILNAELANDNDIINEIIKPNQNREARTNYEGKVMEVINKSNVICVYGMSLGETDKKWWKYISEWLTRNTYNTLIILTHQEKYNKRFPFSQRKVVEPIIEKFLSFSELPEEKKEVIKKKIYIGVNNDVFEMELRNRSVEELLELLSSGT